MFKIHKWHLHFLLTTSFVSFLIQFHYSSLQWKQRYHTCVAKLSFDVVIGLTSSFKYDFVWQLHTNLLFSVIMIVSVFSLNYCNFVLSSWLIFDNNVRLLPESISVFNVLDNAVVSAIFCSNCFWKNSFYVSIAVIFLFKYEVDFS